MKITLEGITFQDILDQMESVCASTNMSRRQASMSNEIKNVAATQAKPFADPYDQLQGPGPRTTAPEVFAGVDNPVDNPVDKPVDKMAKVRAAKAKKAQAAPPPVEDIEPEEVQPPLDPAMVVKIRQKTIEDLQSAYANGHQKEVFELLSRFGNGAKSFRELPPEAFMPIREAIDKGALS